MKCRICNSETTEQFSALVLRKHTVRYFLCGRCFFLQTEEPYWLDEAYRESTGTGDTGIVERSIYFAKIVTVLICLELDKEGVFLDFGGGTGLFTRLMRDVGFNCYWRDPYAKNIFAKGFEYDDKCKTVELVTAFEAFEHFAEPMNELTQMFTYSSNILFSTETLPLPPPKIDQWYYYAVHHGQHVSLYSSKTIQYIARQFDVHYYTNGSDLHFLTKKKISDVRFQILTRYGKFLYPFLKRQLHSRTAEDATGGK